MHVNLSAMRDFWILATKKKQNELLWTCMCGAAARVDGTLFHLLPGNISMQHNNQAESICAVETNEPKESRPQVLSVKLSVYPSVHLSVGRSLGP